MVNVTEVRAGQYFIEEGNIYLALDVNLNKTAMRKMVVKLKVKNMRTGAVTEMARNSGYAIETIRLDKKQMQYLYDTGDTLYFMEEGTCEQIEISKDRLKWEMQFLKGDEMVEITSYEGEILGINLPAKVALKVVHCEAAIRGDTVNRALKDAELETGISVRVPLFIEEGEMVLVRTNDGSYDGRA